MIEIENVEVLGFEHAMRGMRNPMNSWDKSDSFYYPDGDVRLGSNDLDLAKRLKDGGPVHAKYRRFIMCYMDITAPLYWWKEFDTYRVGVEKNSCSTMHKIHDKEFTLDDFSTDKLTQVDDLGHLDPILILDITVKELNYYRQKYLETKDKKWWYYMIQLLPSSYNQKRTVVCSYESLANMHKWRNNHKLDEWIKFCKTIETLPYAYTIIMEGE